VNVHPTPDPCDLDLPTWLNESGPGVDAYGTTLEPCERPDRVAPFQLVIQRDGRRLGSHVFTKASVRIGRSPRCDLRLDDPAVSRFHAAVETVGPGQCRVRDLESSNGVRVNGRKVKGWQLSDGDTIRVGEFDVLFTTDTQPPPPSSRGLLTIRGSTTRVAGRRLEPDMRERSLLARAYLRGHTAPSGRPVQHVLERDVFLIGAGAAADLRLSGWLMPRVCAVIVRGFAGYSVQTVSPRPRISINRRSVVGRCPLEDGDELSVGGHELVFSC
jgi:predicted component of type VI protein secretion system